ncbi:hypothetical protein MON38_17345 [Hymenobacter sp. DH14]|uniref:Outer membrane protein beta-barrel domain-containing protein n=1 Tax=Hymenobacter cyanobacteriorum TaxID=2926463 RepID=A0A9X1VI23_9BACT|nr:hypothetical protein [Hymenobacter cyanobacteriorum]MCI1189192.1 hypothetical protein [Hymenobacter cyanobacteriorum]
MKLRLLFALPALLLASFLAHAQTFEPGLLVRSTGDTLRGEIENGFWVEPPTFIRFRPAPGSAAQLLEPRQLRTVSFTGGRYFRYAALPINHAAETQLDRLPRGYSTDMRTDSLLAEVLLEGPAELLRVVRSGVTHFLIQRTGQPYLELSERKYLRETPQGTWVVADGNNYAAQLSLYFGDCPAAATAAATAPFTAPGMAAVVQAYDKACAGSTLPGRSWLAQARPRRRLAFQGGLLAGGRYNRTELLGYYGLSQSDCSDCQMHPYAGLYAELLQPSRTFAVYGELSFSPFQGQGRTYSFTNTGSVLDEYGYRGLLGTARLGIRYFFPLRHEQQLLLGFGYELNNVLSIRQTSGANAYVLPAQNDFYASPTLLPNVALGWRAQRFTASIDAQLYHDSQRVDFSGNFFGSNYAARVGLSYRLGRNPDAARQ